MELVVAIVGQLVGTSLSPEMWVAVSVVVAFATNPINFIRALLVTALLLIGIRAAALGNLGFLPSTLAALVLLSSLGWGLRVLLVGNKLKPASNAVTPPSSPPAMPLAYKAASDPKGLAEQQPKSDELLLQPKGELVLRSSIKAIPYIVSGLATICLAVSVYFSVSINNEVMLLKAAYLTDKAAKVIPDCTKAAKAAGIDVNPFAAGTSVALAAEYIESLETLKVTRDFHPSGSAEAWPRHLVLLIDIGDRSKRGFCRHRLITGNTEFIDPDRQPPDSLIKPFP